MKTQPPNHLMNHVYVCVCVYVYVCMYVCVCMCGVCRVAHVSLDNMQVARFRMPAYPGESDAEVVTSDTAHLSPWHHITHK